MTERTYVSTFQESRDGVLEGIGAEWWPLDRASATTKLTKGPEVADWRTEQRDGREYIVVTTSSEYEGGTFWYDLDTRPGGP